MSFGAPQATAPQSTFGGTGFGFGNVASTTQGNTGFSFGFGTPATSGTSSTGFGFGTPATSGTSSTGFGFGTGVQPTQSTGFSFGAPAATTTSMFSFGGLGAQTSSTPTFSFGNIGASTSTTPSGFSFGTQPTSAFGGTGGFGITAATGTVPAVATNGQMVDNYYQNLQAAVSNATIYGDGRDLILRKWNNLLASAGTGRGYFSSNAPPVEFSPENLYCRFKAVCYCCIPNAKPEDGLVGLVFNKKEEMIRNQQQQIIDGLKACFGNRPVCVDAIKSLLEDKTEVVIYLMEQPATGTAIRIKATEICNYLEQPNVKPNLANMGILSVYSKTSMSKEQMQSYLSQPPAGIDAKMWFQAITDNPDPKKFMPVPMIGFPALLKRMKYQEYETRQHEERLNVIAEDITELSRRHTTGSAKMAECKRKLLELQHRVLKALVHQEITRKMGFSIQSDEEQLRINLEAIQAELSAPTQFKGHLKEMISRIHMQNYQGSFGSEGERHYIMDEAAKQQIKEHLHLQQEGIAHLINIIKDDMVDLKMMGEISKAITETK